MNGVYRLRRPPHIGTWQAVHGLGDLLGSRGLVGGACGGFFTVKQDSFKLEYGTNEMEGPCGCDGKTKRTGAAIAGDDFLWGSID